MVEEWPTLGVFVIHTRKYTTGVIFLLIIVRVVMIVAFLLYVL